VRVLGLDPGGTTGYAVIDVTKKVPKLVAVGECRDDTLLELEEWFASASVIVCESFIVRPGVNFVGDNMVAPRVIGAATTLAKIHEKRFVLQSPSVKPVAYGLSGQKYVKKKPGMHRQDAIAHAMYYLVGNGLSAPLSKK
jgi:hypothetical protein